MLSDQYSVRTINAALRPGSPASQRYRERAATSPELRASLARRAIAAGFRPTAEHDLLYFGGRIIHDMVVQTIYLGGARAWSTDDRQNIDDALAVALADPGLENVLAQYFGDQPASCRFLPSLIRAGRPRREYRSKDVSALATSYGARLADEGADLTNRLLLFMLPRGATLTDDSVPGVRATALNPALRHAEEVSSIDGLGGYHGSVHFAPGQTAYYAVCVYSDTASLGRANGIPIWDEAWKNVVATAYHEINEARTDPDVEDAINAGDTEDATRFIGWMSAQGEECADFPVFEADPLTRAFVEVPVAHPMGTVPIQLQYSNAVHGPEGPIERPHGR